MERLNVENFQKYHKDIKSETYFNDNVLVFDHLSGLLLVSNRGYIEEIQKEVKNPPLIVDNFYRDGFL